jgi:hypothetical protein
VRRATRPLVAGLLVAMALAWLAPAVGVVPSQGVAAAATDLTLVTDATYTVQPSKSRVRVTMSVDIRNHRGETKTHKYYFDHAFLAVQPGASGFAVTGPKGGSVSVAQRSKNATLLRINFGRLYGGGARSLQLAFNLVDPGRPASRQVRVGSGLVTFPVWAFASDGARGSRVQVRFPAGYAIDVESGAFDSKTKTSDGGTLLATQPLGEPLNYFAYLSAQKDPVFKETPLAVAAGGDQVDLLLRGWRDDPAWSARVGTLFRKSLPRLSDAIGLAWPQAGQTVVQEAVSRTAGGYAGLFSPADRRIEVAYWAEPLVVLHEAAHGWFNGGLVADRWASEGFASYYAQRVAGPLKVRDTSPRISASVSLAAIPLNAWANTTNAGTSGGSDGNGTDTSVDRATEAYGYAASLALARGIAERAGDDAMHRVWADAAAHTSAYQPGDAKPGGTASSTPFAPETVDGPPDWRGLLDLLEAETGKDFTDLWRQWVVRPEESGLLDARAEARTAYVRTLASTGDWQLPRSIRDALRAWQFDTADRQMADARSVLAMRGAVESLATRGGFTLPPAMQQRFEAGDMAGASREAESERNAMLGVMQAAAARSSDDDILSRIGMLGSDPEADLIAAKQAVTAGDLQGAQAHADDAYRAWTAAWQEGRRRALLAMAVLAATLIIVFAVAGRARAARRERMASIAAGS